MGKKIHHEHICPVFPMYLRDPDTVSVGPQSSIVKGTQVEGETSVPPLVISELGQSSKLFAPI